LCEFFDLSLSLSELISEPVLLTFVDAVHLFLNDLADGEGINHTLSSIDLSLEIVSIASTDGDSASKSDFLALSHGAIDHLGESLEERIELNVAAEFLWVHECFNMRATFTVLSTDFTHPVFAPLAVHSLVIHQAESI